MNLSPVNYIRMNKVTSLSANVTDDDQRFPIA